MGVSPVQVFLPLLCLVNLVLIATSLNITTVHYIVPAQSSCPDGRECTDIGTLLNQSERYFTSNTKVVFQSGTYIIDSSINRSILVYNVTDLVITGENTTSGGQSTNLKATLHCQADFNIIIIRSENIHINHLELLECGAIIEPSNFHNRVASSVYEFIRLSDFYRTEIGNSCCSTSRVIKSNFTNIYLVLCNNVSIENMSIEKALAGVTVVTVNVYGHFIISGCVFKGIYRAWYVDQHSFVTGLFHKIKNSKFFSKVSGNSEQQEQEAITVIDGRIKNNLRTRSTIFVIENTTIQGQANVEHGYILRLIISIYTHVVRINLNMLKSYNGQQLIDFGSRPWYKSVKIRVTNTEFRNGTNLDILSFQARDVNQLNQLIVIENLLIYNAVKPLSLRHCTAYLRNVTIEGTRHNIGLSLEDTSLLFEGYNRIMLCNAQTASSIGGYTTGGLLSSHTTVTFRGEMHFDSNSGDGSGAISATGASILIFEGNILFTDNTGFNGGAIALTHTLIIINHTASVLFIRNHAVNYGGAVYVDDNYPKKKVVFDFQCFYELAEWNDSIDYRVLSFLNNTADQAGDSVFAVNGEYDYCNFPSNNKNNKYFPFHSLVNKLETYPSNNISAFASKAKRVCFCTDSRPNCTYVRESKEVYPGQDIHLSVVAIGNGYGTVPATIQARIPNRQQASESVILQPHISDLQKTQVATKYCTGMIYTIYSLPGNHTLLLSMHPININYAFINVQDFEEDPEGYDPSLVDVEVPLLISLSLKECPAGFQLSQETQSCVCHFKLRKNNIRCNINDQTVFRQQSHWLGAIYDDSQNESDVVVYKHCPFDYCKPESMNLRLDNQDEQCSNQRSGVLCGQCQGNLSMVLGTTRCMECSHIWILLILPLSILAGVILVVILTLLNLTVAIGAINGLIFYANIVQTNKAVLFPPLTENIAHLSQFSKTFIAWLNLDLGIELCFYKGLDTYAKSLFQFVFPLYIWTIMIIIIVSSHYSTRIAKLTGRNAVQVLATLFLLSYSKILRGIITALSVTTLDYPNESKLVWLPDGNVDYLKGKHIFLFILSLFVLIVLSVPYTSILMFSQCLQRWSNYKLITWIWKIKPLFDAYTGPYKDKHRYWTGLLLLVRVVLYIVYSTNVGGDPAENILATCITIICVQIYLVLTGGVYKSWPLTILECSYLLNISVLMSTTMYSRLTSKNQDIVTNISVMISFLIACGTVVYHVFLRIKEAQLVKRYVRRKQQNSRRNEEDVIVEGPIEIQDVVPATAQEFYFDKLLNQPLLEECQKDQTETS